MVWFFFGSGFRVSGLGYGDSCLEFRVWGLGFGVSSLGFWVLGLGFRVSGVGFRVSGFGFRVKDRGEIRRCRGRRASSWPRPPAEIITSMNRVNSREKVRYGSK